MSTAKLIRWSGLSSILAGVLYALGTLIHPAGEDVAAMVRPAWIPAHALAGASAIFLLFGLIGLYGCQAGKTGKPGLGGFILASIGSILLAWKYFSAATLLPVIAAKAPTLIEESVNAPSGAALVFELLLAVGFVVGFILFGVATYRAGVLPRWSGLLLIIGIVLSFGGMMSHAVGIVAAAVFGASLAWMGYALWSSQGQVAQQHQPAPVGL